METIHVWAVGDVPVHYRDAEGNLVPGRYVARRFDAPHDPLPQGEEVPAHVDVLRELRRGLHLVAKRPGASERPSAPAVAPARKERG